ncbi:MAG: nickel pincer cofactor biosynthesis protein LarB [Brooklawnia sp.]|jgi:NCAIR mutase (PurE)-related protein
MDTQQVRTLLTDVADGNRSVDEAVAALRMAPFEDLGYAKLDHHRGLRQGVPEVVFGAGKSLEQVEGIARRLHEHGQRPIIITRLDAQVAAGLDPALGLQYFEAARLGVIGDFPEPSGSGTIVVATGGTSDQPVAEEAALVAEALGNQVHRLYDVGVAGVHRLLAHAEPLMSARVVVAIAGMEGALASVIGGLVSCPVIAVPTSVGYGASFGGVAALLSMLNSCASGVSVVNIDNGFGAGYLASIINRIGDQ